MHVLDAAQATVDSYPGGAESLAPRVGMSAGILRNKVNPNCSTNHLTVQEAERIMSVSNDLQMLHAMAANHGCAVVPLGSHADEPVMSMILKLGMAEGDFTRTLHDALADNVITPNELTAIGNASLAEQKALTGLVMRLRSLSTRAGASA